MGFSTQAREDRPLSPVWGWDNEETDDMALYAMRGSASIYSSPPKDLGEANNTSGISQSVVDKCGEALNIMNAHVIEIANAREQAREERKEARQERKEVEAKLERLENVARQERMAAEAKQAQLLKEKQAEYTRMMEQQHELYQHMAQPSQAHFWAFLAGMLLSALIAWILKSYMDHLP